MNPPAEKYLGGPGAPGPSPTGTGIAIGLGADANSDGAELGSRGNGKRLTNPSLGGRAQAHGGGAELDDSDVELAGAGMEDDFHLDNISK